MICVFLLVGVQPHVHSMAASVKLVLGCDLIQLTDSTTQKIPEADDVVRLPFAVPLMQYRLQHLSMLPSGTETLILDTDTVVHRDVSHVFQNPFDVALTPRPPGEAFGMRYNSGVMFSREGKFWAEAHDWLIRHGTDEDKVWYGDQKAIAAVAPGYNVLELPVSEFNWAPNSATDFSAARIWHYKGRVRKKWIPSPSSLATILAKPSPTQPSASPSSRPRVSR